MPKINRNDITLKHLTLSRNSMFFKLLANSRFKDALDKELHLYRSVYTDTLVRLEDGTIWQVEFQSTEDGEMPWRMFQYRAFLLLKFYDEKTKAFPKIIQVVFYTGNKESHDIGNKFVHGRLRLDMTSMT